MGNTDRYLGSLPFWDKLSAEERRLIMHSSSIRSYKKGEFIHSGDCECLGMLFVLSGDIRTYLLSDEGREVTLFRLGEHDCCVLSASCVITQITFETHISAESDCELLIISPSAFSRVTEENIYVRCFMYELAAERFSAVIWSMQQILFKGYDRRLAAFLIEQYDRTGLDELRMTHEQIAQNTSSAREVVARMLKRFAADGLLEFRRGSIRLKDIQKLREMQ